MVILGIVFAHCGETVYIINEKDRVEVPHNDSMVTITNFFSFSSSIPPYDIVAGIGENGNHRVLVGRALTNGNKRIASSKINQLGYICVPILDQYIEIVRRDLKKYIQEHKLTDVEIAICPELSLE